MWYNSIESTWQIGFQHKLWERIMKSVRCTCGCLASACPGYALVHSVIKFKSNMLKCTCLLTIWPILLGWVNSPGRKSIWVSFGRCVRQHLAPLPVAGRMASPAARLASALSLTTRIKFVMSKSIFKRSVLAQRLERNNSATSCTKWEMDFWSTGNSGVTSALVPLCPSCEPRRKLCCCECKI